VPAALEPAQHPNRIGGIRRLLEDLAVDDHDGIGAQYQLAGDRPGLVPSQPPSVAGRRLPRQPQLLNLAGCGDDGQTQHLEELAAAWRG